MVSAEPVTQNAIYRVACLVASYAVVAFFLPGVRVVAIGGLSIVMTVAAVGIILSLLSTSARNDPWRFRVFSVALFAWSSMSMLFMLAVSSQYPELRTEISYFSISLGPVRSAGDVVLRIAFLYSVFRALEGPHYNIILHRIGLCLLMVGTAYVATVDGSPTRDYILPWTSNLSEHDRVMIVYDLCNSLWLTALLPLLLLRETLPSEGPLLPIRKNGVSPLIVSALLSPILLGALINWWYQAGDVHVIDRMPMASWLFKFVTISLWTGVTEEIVFRCIWICSILSMARVGGTAQAQVTAVVASSAVFALAHLGGGWMAFAFALWMGVAYGYAFLWSGNLSACIIGHGVVTTILSRWN